METNKGEGLQKKKRKKGWIIALVLLLVLAILGTTAVFLFGAFGQRMHLAAPPQPEIITGELHVLALAPLPEGKEVNEETLRAYYGEAVTFAAQNGYNTLMLEAKNGMPVYWRDKIFPPAPAVSAQDGFFDKLDPLAILCEAAKKSGVQIWVSVDVYAAAGYEKGMKGKVARMADRSGEKSREYFDVRNEVYAGYLAQSLSELPLQYPVAGVVLQGLDRAALQTETANEQHWAESMEGIIGAVRQNWRDNQLPTTLSLRFADDEETLVTSEKTQALTSEKNIDYLLVTYPEGAGLGQRIAAFSAGGAKQLVETPKPGDDIMLFTAAQQEGVTGAVFGRYPQMLANAADMMILKTALEPAEGLLTKGFDIPQSFAVTYPEDVVQDTSLVRYEQVYIMGTSNPVQPLYMDDVEIGSATGAASVGARAANGVFGVPVLLEEGENTFTFWQGGESYTKTIVRRLYTPPAPVESGGGTPAPVPEPGQAMRIIAGEGRIASALTNPRDASTINETFYEGAVFCAQEGSTPGAYLLPSGDWVYAANCEWIQGDGKSVFSGLSAQAHEKGEYILFEGQGTPAVYIAYEENKLTVTMYDTSFSLPEGFSSTFVRSASVENNEDGSVSLHLALNPVWGYNIEYEDGGTKLFLKQVPVLSETPGKPLEGITVLLDPGHGGKDIGAAGVMGQTAGFNEKDVNLQLAQATAYRLRQMGAEVVFTHEGELGEERMSLGDRLQKQRDLKPDFFLSVHHNSAELNNDRSGLSGIDSFYFHPYPTPASKAFAQNLIGQVGLATGRSGEAAEWNYFLVTRVTICPSVLFEYGFMISPNDFNDITSADGIYAAACGTADAVLETLRPAGTDTGTAEQE